MTAELDIPKSATVESTYKAREVEGALDIYFYRPVGYRFALFFAKLSFTPSMVSLLGAALGIWAGHLYFYRDLGLNAAGMALHVLTNALDNADGQLARLTNRGSLHGAIMDGFADYVVFLSIYVHLALRSVAEGGSMAVWLLALGAAASHALQSMMIDHYRNAYLQFVGGKQSADANSSAEVEATFRRIGWQSFLQKLALKTYLNYTRQQERFAPDLLKLRLLAANGSVGDWFRQEYRQGCQPLIKWSNGLATNARILILFGLLLVGSPGWYFAVELVLGNALLGYVMLRHDAVFRSLLLKAEGATGARFAA